VAGTGVSEPEPELEPGRHDKPLRRRRRQRRGGSHGVERRRCRGGRGGSHGVERRRRRGGSHGVERVLEASAALRETGGGEEGNGKGREARAGWRCGASVQKLLLPSHTKVIGIGPA
jgi:hypothetical protein